MCLIAFTFNEQKVDLKPRVLSGPGNADTHTIYTHNNNTKQTKKDERGFGSERQRQREFYTREMYYIFDNVC